MINIARPSKLVSKDKLKLAMRSFYLPGTIPKKLWHSLQYSCHGLCKSSKVLIYSLPVEDIKASMLIFWQRSQSLSVGVRVWSSRLTSSCSGLSFGVSALASCFCSWVFCWPPPAFFRRRFQRFHAISAGLFSKSETCLALELPKENDVSELSIVTESIGRRICRISLLRGLVTLDF
jgi:hypothetical protein